MFTKTSVGKKSSLIRINKKRGNDLVERSLNKIVFGQIGERVEQTKIIPKEDFKKEYAPMNAITEETEVNGVPCVKITY